MIQTIKEYRRPSTAERFGEAFANAGQAASQLIPEHLQQMQNQKSLREQSSRENEAAKRFGIDLTDIQDPKLRQLALDYKLKGQLEEQSDARKFQNEMTNKEQEEPDQSQEIAQRAFSRMGELVKQNRLGRGSGIKSLLGGKTAKDVGEFTSLTGALESLLVDKVSRGTLSNTRFNYIKDTLLPKPTDSDATIEGKMKGLGEILGLKLDGSTSSQSSDLDELTPHSAMQYQGRVVEDEQGNRYRSTGKKWVKI